MSNPSDFAKTTEAKQTRREMCRGLVRYLILGVLAMVWAVLSVRSGRSTRGAACNQSLSCGGCPLLDQCKNTKAATTRESDKRQ
ncbi:MAG: hypothetical protein ABSA26_11045 [Thermoguttaceae bacterium]|jgi:hypothetical protein